MQGRVVRADGGEGRWHRARSHPGLKKKRSWSGCWTRRICNAFYDDYRAAPARSEAPSAILLPAVRFSTSTGAGQSHSRAVLSSPAVASSRPSGLNATPQTGPVWPVRVRTVLAGGRVPQPRRPVAAGGGEQPPVRAERHTADRAGVAGEGAPVLAGGRVPQPHRPVARRRWRAGRPSGLNATPQTAPVWPVRVRRCSPVAGSHSRAVPSPPAVASSRPSGLNATAPHRAGVAGEGAPVLAGGRVPQPRRPVAAGGGEQPPVRAERHPDDPAGVAGEGAPVLAGGRVPQPRRLVVAGGGEQPPVRAERHPPDRAGRGR